jgi:SH3-like domain-containing protein
MAWIAGIGAASAQPSAPEMLFVKVMELHVRDAPGQALQGWLTCGNRVEVVGVDRKWVQVRAPETGRTGWVHRDFLTQKEPRCVATCVCMETRTQSGRRCGKVSREYRVGGQLLACVARGG